MAKEEKMTVTKYEKARLIGSRALQISMGAEPAIKMDEKAFEKVGYSPVEIAKMEFKEGLIPLKVRRPMPGKAKGEEKAEQKKAEA